MRKSSVVRLSASVVVCGALFTAYTQFGNQPSKLNTIKLKDDLYVIHNDFVPGNTTALITNDGVLLVDDKFEIDHAGIMAELKKITDKPVKYVINTHHHGDHVNGNQFFPHAEILSHPYCRQECLKAAATTPKPAHKAGTGVAHVNRTKHPTSKTVIAHSW